jgi:hypothetical protein
MVGLYMTNTNTCTTNIQFIARLRLRLQNLKNGSGRRLVNMSTNWSLDEWNEFVATLEQPLLEKEVHLNVFHMSMKKMGWTKGMLLQYYRIIEQVYYPEKHQYQLKKLV